MLGAHSEKDEGLSLKTKKASSAGYLSLIYSYRAKYNGSLALFFLSSREIFSNELMILNSASGCGFFALISVNLDETLLRVFSC